MRNNYRANQRKQIGSLSAAEVKRVLDSQEPPLGNNAAAIQIGVNYETMRSVTNDLRIPSVGVIYGIARVLSLDDKWVSKTLALRQKDLVQKKINKAISSGPGTSDIENIVTLLGTLSKDQLDDLKKKVFTVASSNKGKK